MKKQDTQYMDTIVENKFNITNLSYEQKDGLAFAFNIFYHNYADPDDDLDIFDVLEFAISAGNQPLDLYDCTPD